MTAHGGGTRGRAGVMPRQRLPCPNQNEASTVLTTERGVLHHPLHQLVKCHACMSSKLWDK